MRPKTEEEWYKRFNNGPRDITELQLSETWKTTVKMIIMGTYTMTYLPQNMKTSIINLGIDYLGPYTVGLNMSFKLAKGPGSFIATVLSRLQIIGFDSLIPVALEFSFARGKSDSNAVDHLWGFIRACAYIQTKYAGHIIVAICPHFPGKYDTPKSYYHTVKDREKFSETAMVLGKILGVGTYVLQTQALPESISSKVRVMPSWRPEALFNRRLEPTREHFKRLETELEKLLEIVQRRHPRIGPNVL